MPITLRDLLLFITRDIWLLDHTQYSGWKGNALLLFRRLYLSILRFRETSCAVRASSLTTVTLISIVPVLAFAFSLIKGLGGHKEIHDQFIIPSMDRWLGEKQAPELREAAEQLLLFVEQTDLSNLGLIGFFTVVYAVIRLLGSVEDTFNELWRVKSSRALYRKLTDYIGVTLIVPILLLSVVSFTTALQNQDYLSSLIGWMRWGISFLVLPLVWLGFALMYQLMPNTPIRLRSSLSGGVLGGTLWLIVNYAHINLQVGVANYNALYASFSAFPIFIIWVYFSWSAVLVGAAFAAGLQMEEEYRHSIIRSSLDFHDRERLGVMIGLLLTEVFMKEEGTTSLAELASELQEPEASIEVVLADLKYANLVEKTADESYLLSRDPRRITVLKLLQAVKGRQAKLIIKERRGQHYSFADSQIRDFEKEIAQVCSNQTLIDLVESWKQSDACLALQEAQSLEGALLLQEQELVEEASEEVREDVS